MIEIRHTRQRAVSVSSMINRRIVRRRDAVRSLPIETAPAELRSTKTGTTILHLFPTAL